MVTYPYPGNWPHNPDHTDQIFKDGFVSSPILKNGLAGTNSKFILYPFQTQLGISFRTLFSDQKSHWSREIWSWNWEGACAPTTTNFDVGSTTWADRRMKSPTWALLIADKHRCVVHIPFECRSLGKIQKIWYIHSLDKIQKTFMFPGISAKQMPHYHQQWMAGRIQCSRPGMRRYPPKRKTRWRRKKKRKVIWEIL